MSELAIKPLHQIKSMDEYLLNYGSVLGRKAITALSPLHVPNRDPLPSFDDIVAFAPNRKPKPAQAHAIAAAVKMFNAVGSGFLNGTMGTGKTLMSILAVHKHAQLSRNKGGYGGNYRAIVLCPDHLISKWCEEELKTTLPDVTIYRFGPKGVEEVDKPEKKGRKKKGKAKEEERATRATLRDTLKLLDKSEGRWWQKPKGAEWYVLGRNQAKWLSDWTGISDQFPRFGGSIPANSVSSKNVVVDHIHVQDEKGHYILDSNHNPVTKSVTARVHYCPKCGTIVRDTKGVPLGADKLSAQPKGATQKTCRATYLQMIHDPEKPKSFGLDRMSPIPKRFAEKQVGQEVRHGGFKWVVKQCDEPLYHYTSRPYRWAPAQVIQRKLKRMFQYLVIDEVHEHKSDESAQSMACGKLIASVNHVLALTGTIIGGYANHLYPLMMRITPKSLIEEGFEWGKDLEFSKVYGRIDRIVTTTEEGYATSVSGNTKSMRKAKTGNRPERKVVRPGIMPPLFGRHLIGNSIFLTLEEMAEDLPDLFEYVGGPHPSFQDDPNWSAEEREAAIDHHARSEAGWFDVACDMEPEQKAEYRRISAIMEATNKDLLTKGSMKFLGAYLWTSMDYPDRPFGWDHDSEVNKAIDYAIKEQAEEASKTAKLHPNGVITTTIPILNPPHTVGYWDKPGNRKIENFVGVVTPKDLPEDVIYPKERVLIDICKKQKAEGTQTWVYVNMTNKRDIQPRLAKLLEAEGLKVGILRANTVDPIERADWIKQQGRTYDVMISHPQLVSTGLDLFSKTPGGHNYSTIVFYETGYNLFTMRQAARRAWRISQPNDCRVYYLYYRETMQHKAMSLMSKKMAASQALEGEFSADGLAAMAGDDNLQMALAKNLSERIDDSDMQRTWTKAKSGPKTSKKSSVLDTLPPEVQATIVQATVVEMIAESLAESQAEPKPEENPEMTNDWEEEYDEALVAEDDELRRIEAEVEAEFAERDRAQPRCWPEDEPEAWETEAAKEELSEINRLVPRPHDLFVVKQGGPPIPWPEDVDEEMEFAEREFARKEAGRKAFDEDLGKAPEPMPWPEDDEVADVESTPLEEIRAFQKRVEPEPEPVILKMPTQPEPEDDDIPELTPEILCKMYANMIQHGLMTFEELVG